MTPFFAVIGLVSGIRHIIFSGRLGKRYGGIWKRQDSLFEYEAGVANLAFGIMFVIARGKNLSDEVKSVLIMGYPCIYLEARLFTFMQLFRTENLQERRFLQLQCSYYYYYYYVR